MPAREDDSWLTVPQIAKHTGRHPQTIRAALRSGELKGVQRVEGGIWRALLSAVDQWVDPSLARSRRRRAA
ncbi:MULTISPECIES: helix-turn-helix domain-containing protein [unclassified Crossiella]|uniref:helix-turn-helix domain-containing protein n=1 Tax=unclassified Crossiella TaxID=2620835 RepID=UPI001FFE6A26|nr:MULTISPECIES: helix-turn-helix domain-containing protein [unclassified Crossiella]MCK2242190.1 helix-turn-helix domain-containing protein [Crossiella sp. S99.2]MCK2256093.1 helix-turn-helix domain-containing protein [Crossiella sp. S99.1]